MVLFAAIIYITENFMGYLPIALKSCRQSMTVLTLHHEVQPKPRKQLTTEKRYKWIIIFISKGNTLFRQRKYVGEYQLSGRSNWIQNKLTTLVTSVKLENLFPTKEVINRERLSVFFSGPSRFCRSYSHESFEDGGALGTTLLLHAFM